MGVYPVARARRFPAFRRPPPRARGVREGRSPRRARRRRGGRGRRPGDVGEGPAGRAAQARRAAGVAGAGRTQPRIGRLAEPCAPCTSRGRARAAVAAVRFGHRRAGGGPPPARRGPARPRGAVAVGGAPPLLRGPPRRAGRGPPRGPGGDGPEPSRDAASAPSAPAQREAILPYASGTVVDREGQGLTQGNQNGPRNSISNPASRSIDIAAMASSQGTTSVKIGATCTNPT